MFAIKLKFIKAVRKDIFIPFQNTLLGKIVMSNVQNNTSAKSSTSSKQTAEVQEEGMLQY